MMKLEAIQRNQLIMILLMEKLLSNKQESKLDSIETTENQTPAPAAAVLERPIFDPWDYKTAVRSQINKFFDVNLQTKNLDYFTDGSTRLCPRKLIVSMQDKEVIALYEQNQR